MLIESNYNYIAFNCSSLKKVVDNVIVEDLKVETLTKTISIQGSLKEVSTTVRTTKSKKKKIEEAKPVKTVPGVHTIKVELHEVVGELKSVQCMDCDKVKGNGSWVGTYPLRIDFRNNDYFQPSVPKFTRTCFGCNRSSSKSFRKLRTQRKTFRRRSNAIAASPEFFSPSIWVFCRLKLRCHHCPN